MYLRTYSPYLDSFSLVVVNLRIQLELICWALYSTVDCTCHRSCLTYIPSPLLDLTVFTHKVPSHHSLYKYLTKAAKALIISEPIAAWQNMAKILYNLFII